VSNKGNFKKTQKKIQDFRINLLDYLIWFLGGAVASYIICVFIGCFALGVGLKGIQFAMSNRRILVATLICAIIVYVPLLFVMRYHFEHNYVMRRLKNEKRGIQGNLEHSHFMTLREMERNGYRICRSLEELKASESGIILHLEEKKKGNICAIFSPETIHTLVLGTTGSGKTATYIIPSIKALALTMPETRPSFLFTDPKGELHEKTAWYLKQQGYNVLALDFRRPDRSLRWNPLYYAWEKMEKASQVWDNVEMLEGGETPVFRLGEREYNEEEIDTLVRAEVQRLEDEAMEEITNIAQALCPINPKDPIWDEGAKGLIQGVLLAMLEDGFAPDNTGMTLSKFNFYNLHHICTHTGKQNSDIAEYFAYRGTKSRAVSSAEIVLSAPDKQQGSYMSSVNQKLQMFNDRAICNMTSTNEIDIMQMDERPTAVYLMLPDEKEGRHPLGSLFVSQCYKKLVEKAVLNNGTLKRKVLFMMDEYGNMPKIDGVQSMFTVGRSRGIIQIPVIQSYSQLTDKYGHDVANTILGNCNIEIFIGSKDDDTTKRFSEKLGNYTVMSASSTGGKHAIEHSFNESLKERPLMYPRELAQLNNKNDMGNAVIINQGYSPTIGSFTPYFKSKIFELGSTPADSRVARAMDEDELLYNFKARSEQVMSNYTAAMKEADQAIEESETTASEVGIEKSAESKADAIMEQLRLIWNLYHLQPEFTATPDDLTVLNGLVDRLREERKITKLNEITKLKMEYETLLSSESERHEGQNK